jgi:hypothetical protein
MLNLLYVAVGGFCYRRKEEEGLNRYEKLQLSSSYISTQKGRNEASERDPLPSIDESRLFLFLIPRPTLLPFSQTHSMSEAPSSLPNLSAPRPEVDGSNSRLRSSLGVPKGWQDPQMPLCLTKVPPLPNIKSPKLATQARTHPTIFTSTMSQDLWSMYETIQDQSYESLEYVGDKHLATCVAVTIRRRYPGLPPSQITVRLPFLAVSSLTSLTIKGIGSSSRSRLESHYFVHQHRLPTS